MKKKNLTLTVGEKLKICRKRLNLPARKMAKKLHMSLSTYSDIEADRVVPTEIQLKSMPVLDGTLSPNERLSVHVWRFKGTLEDFCDKHDLNYTRISAICNGSDPYTEEKIKIEKLIGEW